MFFKYTMTNPLFSFGREFPIPIRIIIKSTTTDGIRNEATYYTNICVGTVLTSVSIEDQNWGMKCFNGNTMEFYII